MTVSRSGEKATGIKLIKLINFEFSFKLLCLLFSQQIQPETPSEWITDKLYSLKFGVTNCCRFHSYFKIRVESIPADISNPNM